MCVMDSQYLDKVLICSSQYRCQNCITTKVVRAISKSNPQPHRARSPVKPQPRSRKDFIIDIIDSALGGEAGDAGEAGGDLVNGLGSRPPSSESIDRADTRPRRASSGSVTLSLVFDMEADKPVFRRL